MQKNGWSYGLEHASARPEKYLLENASCPTAGKKRRLRQEYGKRQRAQLIALPGEVLDSIINDDVAKLAVIVPNADKPVGGDEEKPVIKPAEHKVEKTQQVVAKPTPTTAKIPATGDTMANGLAATVLAGITALLGSLAFGRKRS